MQFKIPTRCCFLHFRSHVRPRILANLVLFTFITDKSRIARIDLTAGQHYSLTDATEKVLDGLEEPVEIIFFHSPAEVQHPLLRPLIDPVKDTVAEFGAVGGDMVRARAVDLDNAVVSDAFDRFERCTPYSKVIFARKTLPIS